MGGYLRLNFNEELDEYTVELKSFKKYFTDPYSNSLCIEGT